MAKRARLQTGADLLKLVVCTSSCWECQGPLYVLSYKYRTLVTLEGVRRLRLQIRRCVNPECPRFHRCCRPEAEGALVLPHSEVGLDVIARVGALRFAEHRSVPEMHAELTAQGVQVAPRTVTNLLARYEELLAVHLHDGKARQARLRAQRQVILAIDGLQPDVGHEVLWVLRDVLSGEILQARSLLSSTEADLAHLIWEVQTQLPVPIRGVISDGQRSLRNAVRTALPNVPHQLCQFHYLRDAAQPIFEADRHAKKELKKLVRGVRPIERELETALAAHRDGPPAAEAGDPGCVRTAATPQEGAVTSPTSGPGIGPEVAPTATPAAAAVEGEVEAVCGYCLAIRSALTDDGRPPLGAAGLKLQERLTAIRDSVDRVVAGRNAEKGGVLAS